ncbi:MAG: hypothetical protein EBE86_034685 [Hormoscilla sp. GUM202]|nr:hypothetical protein [Hormoscilla sp. GUM202]
MLTKKEQKSVTDHTNQESQPTPPASGSIDESEREFSQPEKAIAQLLAIEGKTVKALSEKPDEGRNADAEVDGVSTEFKSLVLGATNPTVKNAINNSIRRGGQARDIIIDSRGSGLTETEAMTGLQRAKNITRGKIDSIRIIGDRYDITATDFL